MDKLAAIRVFCRVVETGGFTKAANSLAIPKATASKLIGDLEASLRLTLLKRTTRSVRVTVEGAAYYDRVSRWLGELDDIEGAFEHERERPGGRVTADVSAWVASGVLIPMLPRFYAKYPDIRVQLRVSDRAIHLIREGTDLVVRGGALATPSTVVGRRLGESRWVTAASKAYVARFGLPSHPEELMHDHVLVHQQRALGGRPIPFRFSKDGEELLVDAPSRLVVNESNAQLAAGLAGVGVLQSLEWKLRPHLASGQLVELLSDWTRPSYPFHVLYPAHRHISARVRAFVDWLVVVFHELERPPGR